MPLVIRIVLRCLAVAAAAIAIPDVAVAQSDRLVRGGERQLMQGIVKVTVERLASTWWNSAAKDTLLVHPRPGSIGVASYYSELMAEANIPGVARLMSESESQACGSGAESCFKGRERVTTLKLGIPAPHEDTATVEYFIEVTSPRNRGASDSLRVNDGRLVILPRRSVAGESGILFLQRSRAAWTVVRVVVLTSSGG